MIPDTDWKETNYYNICLTAFFQDNLGKQASER